MNCSSKSELSKDVSSVEKHHKQKKQSILKRWIQPGKEKDADEDSIKSMQEFAEENEKMQSEFEDIYNEILEIVRSNTPTPTSLPITGGKKPKKKGILKKTKCGREKEEWGFYDCGSKPRYPSCRQR